ncbi:hypothetical protein OAI12_01440 [Porticoccaceae bacterium]|nr:hypothetical protein [Porticoccaceae bacterium]
MEIIEETQIELNKIYGKRLIAIAWMIEVVAASIGLFIGFNTASTSVAYYSELDSSSALSGDAFSNVFIGAAPFIIIAAVELTKIPLVLGFYRTRDFVWRSLFLVTLLCLIFVTFETMFNGLERSFTVNEDSVAKPKRALMAQNKGLEEIERQIRVIQTRTSEDIDQEYADKIIAVLDERTQSLEQSSAQKADDMSVIRERQNSLSEQFLSLANVGGLGKKVERVRSDLAELKKSYDISVQKLKDRHDDYLIEVNGRLGNIDGEESNAIENKGLFASTSEIKKTFEDKRRVFLTERAKRTETFDNEFLQINGNYSRTRANLEAQLNEAEKALQASEANSSGLLQGNQDQLNFQMQSLSEEYSKVQADITARSEERIDSLERQKASIIGLQRAREESLPTLELKLLEARQNIVQLEDQINTAARGNQIYRITQSFYGHDNASEVTKDQLKVVGYTWFGSIAFIAASVGAILALAGFILQDPEAYRKKPKPIFTALGEFLAAYIASLRNRRVGVVRNALRAMAITVRRFIKSPRIRFVEIKVPEVVIKEVPGPERIVVKEVAKEIIRKEIVYVPLYSVREGTKLKEGDDHV